MITSSYGKGQWGKGFIDGVVLKFRAESPVGTAWTSRGMRAASRRNTRWTMTISWV
ncbi:hypothetical protein [Nonomuraea sp. NPDC048901]|uniref:hypothetical protein n=1 Tax=Nonomuraea sp. NPDC048901 TaxID=3155627 RepID=UPI0033FAF99E